MGAKCSRPTFVVHLGPKVDLQEQETGISEDPDTRVKLKPSMYIGSNKTDFVEVYTPVRKLGTGGYAEVYLCNKKGMNTDFAVKVVKKSKLSEKKLTTGILNEVDYLRQLDHPNIAKLYDVYEDDVAFYIIMEACYGGELFDEIVRREKLTEQDACDIIRQLLSGVCYLHKHKIVHRDLKPENLLLESREPNARIKIVDFGLSAHLSDDALRDRLGTVYYIAPEVIRRKYDEKCDVWSCGVILYILLCGFPPFAAPDDDAIIRRIIAGEFSFPGREWAQVSRDAKDLITKMLTYDPRQRISAAHALKHPWIRKHARTGADSPQAASMSLALQNLRRFTKTENLAQAAMMLMVNKFTTNQDLDELTRLFAKLDTNCDGALDRRELIEGYAQCKLVGRAHAQNLRHDSPRMSLADVERVVDEIIRTCDLDHSGEIDYSGSCRARAEFITGCIDKAKLLSRERLRMAFSTFDVDGSGKISKSELAEVLGAALTPQILGISKVPDTWAKLLDSIDANNDGEIDFDEFVSLLNQMVSA